MRAGSDQRIRHGRLSTIALQFRLEAPPLSCSCKVDVDYATCEAIAKSFQTLLPLRLNPLALGDLAAILRPGNQIDSF